MKKTVLLLILAAVMTVLVIFTACGDDCGTTAPGTSGADPTTTKAEVTTARPTVTENGIPLKKLSNVSVLVREKNFKEEGLALMKLITKDFYNSKTNMVLKPNGNNTGMENTTLWAVGSFLEGVAATYKMYPEDEEIKATYEGLLNKGLIKFRQQYLDNGFNGAKVNGVTPFYYNASAGNKGDYYYDDDIWIAIQYIEAYHALGKKAYLTKAQEILEFIWLGWGIWDGAEEYDNGGIPWKVGTGPTTCSNAPAAYAFALFSEATTDDALKKEYLDRSITTYQWVRKYLTDGARYKDSFDNNWSGAYNNGLMIAAGARLYTITGEKDYYNDARRTANAAYSYNTKIENGKLRFNNDNDTVWMSAWLVKGWIEFYKIDTQNSTGYLNKTCEIMRNALELKLDSGYLRARIHDATCEESSTDTVNLGGGVTILMVLSEWAELYGKNYQ